MFAYSPTPDRSGEILGIGQMRAAETNANTMRELGSNIGNALAAIGGMYGQFQDKKQGAMALDQAVGMASDEGLISRESLDAFLNLPWKQKKPVFDLMTATIVPIAANRMKVTDQARIWSQYRGANDSLPDGAFTY